MKFLQKNPGHSMILLEYEWNCTHCDKNSDQKTSNLHIACTKTDFKLKFFTGRPSPRFNDAVTGGQPGGSSQNGGQPGGSSQTGGQNGGQPGGSSQTGGQPGGSSQTGGEPGGSSQTGGQPGGSSQTGGAIGLKPTGVSLMFIALTMLPFVIFVH